MNSKILNLKETASKNHPKKIVIDGKPCLFYSEIIGDKTWISIEGWTFQSENTGTKRLKRKQISAATNGSITAPMPGQILKIFVNNGQEVATGDALFIVEAMKMEHTLKAPCQGLVTDLNFKSGDNVSGSDIILKIKPSEDE